MSKLVDLDNDDSDLLAIDCLTEIPTTGVIHKPESLEEIKVNFRSFQIWEVLAYNYWMVLLLK